MSRRATPARRVVRAIATASARLLGIAAICLSAGEGVGLVRRRQPAAEIVREVGEGAAAALRAALPAG